MAKHMLSNLWGREPATILFLIQATIAGAVTFGLKLTGEQTAAIMTFSSALIAVVTRQSMASPATVSKLKADVAAASDPEGISLAAKRFGKQPDGTKSEPPA